MCEQKHNKEQEESLDMCKWADLAVFGGICWYQSKYGSKVVSMIIVEVSVRNRWARTYTVLYTRHKALP